MRGKRWMIFRIDRGEDGEDWTGVKGPATNPPEDCGLAGVDWCRAAAVEVLPVAEVANAERELRVRAARTPIPSQLLEEGRADGLEQAANLLRDLIAPAKETDSEPT